MSQKYSPEFKAKALRLIEERVRAEQCSGWAACTDVGEALGRISPHTLRGWWKQSRIDRGEAPGVSTDESGEMRRLRRENLELRRADEILRKASAFPQQNSTAPRRDDPVHRRTP